MSRRSTLADLLKDGPVGQPASIRDVPAPLASGALRAMSLSLEKMSSAAEEARDLKSRISAGGQVVDLDPETIDASFITDRLPVAEDAAFEGFVKSISEQGQQVPILVRPHPSNPNRYQVAYGHRRLKAAARLRISVRAVIRPLTDTELVIAQAKENLDRQDLSYIERALLARQLEERQFDRSVIMAALGVDKADLSRFLSVAHGVPPELVQAIGPAPRVGRPRWVQLCEAVKSSAGRKRALAATATDEFRRADTDHRFAIIVGELQRNETSHAGTGASITSSTGRVLAHLEESPRRARVVVEDSAFRTFLLSRIPSLVEEFERQDRGSENHPRNDNE